jgi:hypothetical protein
VSYYDREGQPIDEATWSELATPFERRIVQHDQVSDLVEVLTVWHGQDLEDPLRDPPLIYGTVIKFVGKIVEEIPTATERQARVAHRVLVRVERDHPRDTL